MPCTRRRDTVQTQFTAEPSTKIVADVKFLHQQKVDVSLCDRRQIAAKICVWRYGKCAVHLLMAPVWRVAVVLMVERWFCVNLRRGLCTIP